MKKYKDKHKSNFTKILLFAFLSIVLLLATGLLSVSVYLENSIDSEADEALFQGAREKRETRLFHATRESGARLFDGVTYTEELLPGGEKMLWADIAEMPEALKNAFIAIEDHGFYEHGGVDILRTGKAFLNSIFGFEKRFGASTITQQTVKNLTGDREQSAFRKLREIYRALQMEERHGKNEILELYLNIIPFTDGCIGVKAAAKNYFGKELSALSPAECASLAAVTNAPASYHPRRHKEAHLARRDLILGEMRRYGFLSEEAYQEAVKTPLALVAEPEADSIIPWYTETVLTDVIQDLAETLAITEEKATRLVYGGGLQIYTCQNEKLQRTLEAYFENEANFADGDRLTYAMTVVDPYTGDLLATVGKNGEKSGNRILDYAGDVRTAPGSALKPLALYAPALENGIAVWSTVFDDVPVSFEENAAGYKLWPQNANRIYSGLVSFADAVKLSKNTVAVRLYDVLGAEKIYRTLTEDFGLTGIVRRKTENGKTYTDMAPAPLALGQLTFGVTLRELTTAYTAFADAGHCHKSRSYTKVLDKDGNLLIDHTPSSKRVLSPENAAIMTKLLEGVVKEGTASSLALKNRLPLAGKTGTAGKGEDRFFVGYTPYLVAGIYCGSPDKSSVTGGSFKGHLKVYDEVMARLHSTLLGDSAARRRFPIPAGVTEAEYCMDSGMAPDENCALDLRGERTAVGYFRKGTEPAFPCTRHIPVLFDKEGNGVACDACLREETELAIASLIRVTDRSFPVEVAVKDARYVYRPLEGAPLCRTENKPFFQNAIPKGRFVGVTTGIARQENAVCPLHGETDLDMPDAGKGPDGSPSTPEEQPLPFGPGYRLPKAKLPEKPPDPVPPSEEQPPPRRERRPFRFFF